MKPYRKGHKSIKHIIHLNVKGMRIMFAERGFFLKKFLAHPTQIGSVTPSTKHLAETMLRRLDWANMKQVVELGAGTGVFTEYIEAHRRPDCRALIIEQDKLLRKDLSRRFPRMEFGAQAETLPFLMQKFGMEKADCIISGLPFARTRQRAERENSPRGARVAERKRRIRRVPIFAANLPPAAPDFPRGADRV